MVLIQGTRPGSAVVWAQPDIARSLVADGYAEYVSDKPAKGGGRAGDSGGAGSPARRTRRKPSGRGSSEGDGGA